MCRSGCGADIGGGGSVTPLTRNGELVTNSERRRKFSRFSRLTLRGFKLCDHQCARAPVIQPRSPWELVIRRRGLSRSQTSETFYLFQHLKQFLIVKNLPQSQANSIRRLKDRKGIACFLLSTAGGQVESLIMNTWG